MPGDLVRVAPVLLVSALPFAQVTKYSICQVTSYSSPDLYGIDRTSIKQSDRIGIILRLWFVFGLYLFLFLEVQV